MQVVTSEESSAQYRCSRAGWDVEERHSVLGALRNGVVLRDRVKGLEVHQHLVRLVDTAIQTVTATQFNFFFALDANSHPSCVQTDVPGLEQQTQSCTSRCNMVTMSPNLEVLGMVLAIPQQRR